MLAVGQKSSANTRKSSGETYAKEIQGHEAGNACQDSKLGNRSKGLSPSVKFEPPASDDRFAPHCSHSCDPVYPPEADIASAG